MRKAFSALIWALCFLHFSVGQAASAKGQFSGDVVAMWLANGRDMQLTEPFTYVDARGTNWTVPKGTVVDGASIPRALWSVVGAPFAGSYRKASVVHDFFCQTMSRPWKEVHQTFYEASLAEGNSVYHAKLLYGAVYAWGPRWETAAGRPVRTRDAARPPMENELQELSRWIEGGNRSLADISSFIDNRFPRAGSTAERRVALVVGNSAYAHTRGLPNARHDAQTMAEFLQRVGFQVTARQDANYEQLRAVVHEFGRASAGADYALVYFAGHGLEVAGENYLLPIDAKLSTSADLEYEAIALASVLDIVRTRRKLNLLIIDACRNNPLAEKMALREGAKRSVRRGLARVEPKGDMLIAFAANAGTVAQDGTGLNSPFVEALVKHLGKPGLDIRLALGAVRDSVLSATGNNQEPAIYGALSGHVISLVHAEQAANSSQPGVASREQEARAAWDAAKESCSAADIELFLARYKDTFFGDLAGKRLGEIKRKSICVAAMDAKLIRGLQTELKRLGCFAGPVNGTWGPQSMAGFKAYVQHAKLPEGTSSPSKDVLAAMARTKGRLCPAVCASDEKPSGDKCIKALQPPPAAKPNPAPQVVAGDCGSVRRACMQLRSQCIRTCREKLAAQTFGNCDGCLNSFSTCVTQGSSGTCR